MLAQIAQPGGSEALESLAVRAKSVENGHKGTNLSEWCAPKVLRHPFYVATQHGVLVGEHLSSDRAAFSAVHGQVLQQNVILAA